jgi:demethylmenaquinone methyltransferase/2-methoxy-6-polyprenyl-1,4-benzoquinol methylase
MMGKRILNVDQIKSIYKNQAANYDASLWFFYLMGFRIKAYRKAAVDGLNLKAGNTVIDLGCGTGLNFKLLQKKVGPTGKIIGVDLSEGMLGQAKDRIRRSGWQNVRLVQADMYEYNIPEGTDGVLSTLALTMSPNYDQIIKKAAASLSTGARISIFELKKPEKWPDGMVQLMVNLLKRYGTRLEHTQRTPWLSIDEHLSEFTIKEY